MRSRLAFALLSATACGACAAAASAGAPVTPRQVQRDVQGLLISIGAGDLAIAPTRLPAHYAYESYSVTGDPLGLDLSFADGRYVDTIAVTRQHELRFDASYYKRPLRDCGAKAAKTLRVSGSTVFSDGTTVWRCVRASDGRLVKETATGRAADASLALLVVSARPIG